MAGGEQLLVQESAVPVISSDADLSTPTVRLAHFLHPRAGAGQRPPLPSPPRNAGPILADGIQVEFKGWAEAPNLWTRWVAKLRPRCEPLWRKLGIQDAVLATTCRVRRDERTMLQLAAIWSAETNTFVFPWGEATLWVLARFPELRPEMATTLDPVARHQPWAARWHEAHKCLRACELVGMRCIEQYNPHRVARQLGFDQDVPGSVARVNSDWKIAWGTYFMEPSNFAFIVPQYMMAVTFEYTRWWRPYASGCDTAIDNNVNSKEFPVLVSPRDKNMEVLHDDNSGKKQHVLPGMSRPDTFEVFFSRLNTFEVSQTDIPLVEKLNGLDTIQGTLEHLAEVAGSAQIADNSTLRCVRKGTETKNVKQASPDVFAKQNSSSEHGATVGHVHLFKRAVSTTNRKTIGATVGHVQPSLEDIVVMLDEEFDESVGKEHEVGATVGHVQPSLEDVIVISDEEFDESVGKEHEVGAMPREGNEKANEDASALNQQSDTLMEDCIVANRKSSGNNKMYSSNQVDANPELVKRVISTKTLYYLRPIGPVKDAQERDATGTNTDQGADLPRREVGTREMIEEASAAREAEKVVLQKVIDSLKEEIAAAQALGDLRDGSPSKT
ncbi:unnamed protein product [Triticum turgidum subsp. durum]|uniref:Aminotransferase-like plant mobile domain-containing protein n=1 Tax=Triticum turgidum subsp. durum TaxID=4567 RepID=A0A9R0QY43_TRITD|nr:unnamed protein product [Triticum turgidum subsp. durum]